MIVLTVVTMVVRRVTTRTLLITVPIIVVLIIVAVIQANIDSNHIHDSSNFRGDKSKKQAIVLLSVAALRIRGIRIREGMRTMMAVIKKHRKNNTNSNISRMIAGATKNDTIRRICPRLS